MHFSKPQPIAEAVRAILSDEKRPIISAGDLEHLIYRIYTGEYLDQFEVMTKKSVPSEQDVSRAIRRLQSARVVRPDPDFGGFYQVFDVLGQSAEAVCCQVDPLCYMSHLSAMQAHGLTDRSPTHLVLSRPAVGLWKDLRIEMQRAQADPRGKRLNSITRYKFPDVVRERPVLMHDVQHPGLSMTMGPQGVRVATIGQAFLDMMVRPAWCGGIPHVLEIWEREAGDNIDAIIETVGSYPKKLPIVRAGYILNEVLGIQDERVLAWRQLAQRGSSQKLDPDQPYASTYSEVWMISINA